VLLTAAVPRKIVTPPVAPTAIGKGPKKDPPDLAASTPPRASGRKRPGGPKKTKSEKANERPESNAAHAEDGGSENGAGADDEEQPEESETEAEAEVEAEAEPADAEVDHVEVADRDVPEPTPSSSITRFDPMAAYLREVQRHPLLTPEQTRDLAIRFVDSQDPAAAAQLVTANLRLVVKIAYEYRRAYKNIMDLVQEGNIGLMQAVKRYDPYRGVKLSSYAAWWIRAYILRFILNNWRLVKLGTTQAQRKLFFNLRKKRAELVAMGIEPTDAEVAKRLNVPESDVTEMDVRLTSTEKSLDAPVGDAEGRAISKIDMMPSASQGPESLVADEELQALLKDKLQNFRKTLVGKEKDLAIFDERLVADEPLTLQELGDRFGISRERVRQLEQRLTSKLRDYLRVEMGDAAQVG
jgi:RNA polymerase sigma-32 factor